MHRQNSVLRDALLGAAAGVVGTVVIRALTAVQSNVSPDSDAMIKDPGRYMMKKAREMLPEGTRENVPTAVETTGAIILSLGYGAFWGGLFGATHRKRLDVTRTLTDGVGMGLICWAAGYLGWLPAMRMTKPLSEQRADQIAVPAIEHAIYGATTAAVFEGMLGMGK